MIYVSYIKCFEKHCMSYGCCAKATIGHMICNISSDNLAAPYFNMYCTCDDHKDRCRGQESYIVSTRFLLKLLKKHKEKQLNNFGTLLLLKSNDELKEYILQ